MCITSSLGSSDWSKPFSLDSVMSGAVSFPFSGFLFVARSCCDDHSFFAVFQNKNHKTPRRNWDYSKLLSKCNRAQVSVLFLRAASGMFSCAHLASTSSIGRFRRTRIISFSPLIFLVGVLSGGCLHLVISCTFIGQ
jgi:hypothetical protein